jgi:hypothetical protein
MRLRRTRGAQQGSEEESMEGAALCCQRQQ